MYSARFLVMGGFSLGIVVLSVATPVAAQTTYDWSNPVGGLFQTAGNWSPVGGPPAGLDTARFNLNGNYTISFSADRTNQFLHVGNDHVTLDLSGRTYTQTGDYPTVTLGLNPGDASNVTVRNGTWSSNWTALGLFWPGQVSLTLPGPMTWQNTNAIYIGGGAPTVVEANNGANVTCLWTSVGANTGGGSGTLRVLGPTTTWTCNGSVMEVGRSTQGTLLIDSGGHVACSFASIASLVDSVGTATVNGVNALWHADAQLIVGEAGDGSLNVLTGGRVEAARVLLGYNDGSHGTATINGTLDINSDGAYAYVGYGGDAELTLNGTLNVTDPGGTVGGDDGFTIVGSSAGANGLLTINSGGSYSSSAQLQLGALAGSQGTVIINTGGSAISRLAASSPSGSAGNVGRDGTGIMTIAGGLWNCLDGALNVGFNAGSNGTMTINSGGTALSIGGSIGRVAGATGNVLIDGPGSDWTSTGTLNVGMGGTGTLTVVNGGLAAAPSFQIGINGTVGGVGTLSGTVNNGGTLAPGDVPGPADIGLLTINGALSQSSAAKIVVDISGTAVAQRDRVQVSGAAALAGTLQINLIGGFIPSPGQEFQIITAGSVSNTFEDISGAGSGYLEAIYDATTVKLRYCQPCDTNCDGVSNGRDIKPFVNILLGVGAPCGSCAGDANRDAITNMADVAAFVQCLTAP